MDKLIYEAESYIFAVRVGASIYKNQDLINMLDEYNNQPTNGNLKFDENNIHLSGDDAEMQKIKISNARERLKEAIEQSKTHQTNYTLTSVLYYLSEYKNLKSQQEKIEKIVKAKTSITEFFGDFDLRKQDRVRSKLIVRNKTSQELTNERNDRLAILNHMHSNGKVSDEELKKLVVHIMRIYNRAIEEQAEAESKKEAEEVLNSKKITTQLKTKISKIVNKVKKVFKLGGSEQKEQDDASVDNERMIIDRSAMQAMGKTADLIAETEDIARPEVKDFIFEMNSDIVQIASTQVNKINLMQIASEIYGTKVKGFGEALVVDESGNVIPNTSLQFQKDKFIAYMHAKYETHYDVKFNMPIEKFKDAEIEAFYKSVIKQFDTNIEKVKELEKVKDVVADMSQQYIEDLQR